MEISSARSAATAAAVPLLLLVVLMLPHAHAHRGSSHMGHQGKPAGPHKNKPPFRPGPWKNAHATFYGSSDGSDTYEGACGYEQKNGYGLQTAAISQAMFNNGQVCGACFELKCFNDPQWCKPGQPSITITATNLCPPSEQQSSENGGWCNPPREHFDLTQPAFLQLSSSVTAGILPVQYRRVPCPRQGGIRFTITGNPYFNLVQVTNVGGAGDVTSLQVKGHKELKWTQLTRNWGQKWQTDCKLVGESLTFRVGTSDDRFSTSWHVAPKDWQFGQTFEGKNFKK